MTAFADLLQAAEARFLTRRDVARLLRVSPQTVSNWAGEGYAPSPQHEARIEDAMTHLTKLTDHEVQRLRNGKARRTWIKSVAGE